MTLTPRYLAPIEWYRRLALAGGTVTYDITIPMTKRDKPIRRATILDTRGELTLTVPVVHAPTGTPLDRLIVSNHGRWHEIHRLSLEAAYGRTPYFEHLYPGYKDLIGPHAPGRPLVDLILDIDTLTRRHLALPTPVTIAWNDILTCEPVPGQEPVTSNPLSEAPSHLSDTPNHLSDASEPVLRPYDRARHFDGTLPADLSILDLLFNLGPREARDYLLAAP